MRLPCPTPQSTILDLVTDHAGSHSADPAHYALSALEDVAPPELLVAEQHINAHGHDPGHWLV
jgi:hypothetical protein